MSKRRTPVRITFDDGPSPCTEKVLDILRGTGLTATFYALGMQTRKHPGVLRRAHREGHVIGNHTDTHAFLTALPDQDVEREMRDCTAAIVAAGVPPPRLFRPPFGAVDDRVRSLAGAMGMETVLWDADPRDWQRPGTEEIVRRTARELGPGCTLMLHDGDLAQQTVEALPAIIAHVQRLSEASG